MRALAFVAGLTLGFAAPAWACRVEDKYRVPTNLELAAEAELVLLGTIESGPTDLEFDEAAMVVRPIIVLKGELPSNPIKLPGMIGRGAFALKSNPRNLEFAHPLSGIGSCWRFSFPQGSTVLFFLKRIDDFQGPAGGPFSRWAEDVPSVDAPWVRAARLYVKVAALPKEQQAAALRHERDELLRATDADAKLLVADIDRQLAGPNKPWNQLMDEQIKEMRERGEDPLVPTK